MAASGLRRKIAHHLREAAPPFWPSAIFPPQGARKNISVRGFCLPHWGTRLHCSRIAARWRGAPLGQGVQRRPQWQMRSLSAWRSAGQLLFDSREKVMHFPCFGDAFADRMQHVLKADARVFGRSPGSSISLKNALSGDSGEDAHSPSPRASIDLVRFVPTQRRAARSRVMGVARRRPSSGSRAPPSAIR